MQVVMDRPTVRPDAVRESTGKLLTVADVESGVRPVEAERVSGCSSEAARHYEDGDIPGMPIRSTGDRLGRGRRGFWSDRRSASGDLSRQLFPRAE
jgi:hypothetical protein